MVADIVVGLPLEAGPLMLGGGYELRMNVAWEAAERAVMIAAWLALASAAGARRRCAFG
jgi:hypothetical protein